MSGRAHIEREDGGPPYCGHCGRADGEHEVCLRRLELEPPRYCTECRRRMIVQVLPDGWHATCSRHGTTEPPRRG